MNTNNNYCVIMAGGIGARFWPYSKNSRPKQFLDFFGTGRSLIQLTFDRFRQVVPVENILIVSNRLYKDLILEQLPELKPEQVLLEPMRRNTAPWIYYAVSRIKSKTDKANIIVAPSDHLILNEVNFLETIRQGLDFVEQNDALLTLGIKPSRPETGYGYIQIDDGDGSLRKVQTFTEKPNLELAKVFFESGEFRRQSPMRIKFLKGKMIFVVASFCRAQRRINIQHIDSRFQQITYKFYFRHIDTKGVLGSRNKTFRINRFLCRHRHNQQLDSQAVQIRFQLQHSGQRIMQGILLQKILCQKRIGVTAKPQHSICMPGVLIGRERIQNQGKLLLKLQRLFRF